MGLMYLFLIVGWSLSRSLRLIWNIIIIKRIVMRFLGLFPNSLEIRSLRWGVISSLSNDMIWKMVKKEMFIEKYQILN